MGDIIEGGARRIDDDDVAKVIAEITQAAEDATGAVSIMIATGRKWEKWWQGVLTVGLAAEPWSRAPGRPDDGSTIHLERSLSPERGTAYARKGRTASGKRPKRKLVDVVVAREPGADEAEHLIELKLLELGDASTRAKRERTLKEIREKDIPALISVTGGVKELGSAWAVAIAVSHQPRRADKRTFRDLTNDGRWKPEIHKIKLRNESLSAYVVGVRVA